MDGVSQVGGHVEQVAGNERSWGTLEGPFRPTGEDLDESVGCRRVFRQFLSGGEAEQDKALGTGAEERPADDAVWGELGFVGERDAFQFAGL